MHAPIVWSRERGGYELRESDQSTSWQLPGFWFCAQEIHALLTLEQLLETLHPGLLGRHVRPLQARVARLLGSGDQSVGEVRRRLLMRHYDRLDDA